MYVDKALEGGYAADDAEHVSPVGRCYEFSEAIVDQNALLEDICRRLKGLECELAKHAKQHQETQELLNHVAHQVHRKWSARFQSRLFHLHQYAPLPMQTPVWYSRTVLRTDPPLISLVTPSFNQAAFLPRTIQSVLDQDYPRLQYVVQDGGSNDGSVEVLKQYESRLTAWTSAPDGGQANAINLGFSRTTGSIMGWLNSDDMLLPGALKCVARYFQDHPDVDVVYGSRFIIDGRGREIGKWLLPPHDDKVLQWVDYVPQETLFWRREIWERSGGSIDESFNFAMDWDLLLRFQKAGAKFACIPRFLGAFRVTENTKTSRQIATVGQEEIDRLRQRTLGFVPDAYEVHAILKQYLRRHVWRRVLERMGILRY